MYGGVTAYTLKTDANSSVFTGFLKVSSEGTASVQSQTFPNFRRGMPEIPRRSCRVDFRPGQLQQKIILFINVNIIIIY